MPPRKIALPPKKAAPAPATVRPLTRPAASPSKVPPKAASSASDGFAKARAENQRIAAQREQRLAQPFRLRIKAGENRKVIVTDVKPFFINEHQWEGKPGVWNRFCVCIKDSGRPCPACNALGKEGVYVMMLTVIDLNPYKDKEGKIIKVSKKLLPVKSSMIEKYERLYLSQKKSLRGTVLQLFRSATNTKAPNTGDDFQVIKILTEAELARYKDLAKPCDYDKAFPQPSVDELKALFRRGGAAVGEADVAGDDELLDEEVPF